MTSDQADRRGPARQASEAEIADLVHAAARIRASVESVVEGKGEVVRTALTVLLAEGHLLIEDVPGVGKTMLAKTLAKSLDCTVRRIQFTPDLLPSDVTGVSVFNQDTRDFEFRPGAIFANVVLGEETSVWPGAVIRADSESIVIGDRSNVQDGCVIRTAAAYLGGHARDTVIGSRVTVGHQASLHGCTIEDSCLIGMNSSLLEGCTVRRVLGGGGPR